MSTVHKHRVGYQPLSGGISLYRHGSDPRIALEQRDALQEVMMAACQHLLHGMEEAQGITAEIQISRKKYIVALFPTRVARGGRLVRNPRLKGLR